MMLMQVITESLPISSSGHVALLQFFFLEDVFSSYQSLQAFDYFLQGVSACVIFVYFFPVWWQLVIKQPLRISSLYNYDVWTKSLPRVFLFGFVADFITFMMWYFDFAHAVSFPLLFGFMITTVLLWSMQFSHEKKDIDIWSLRSAVILGCVQSIALFPGISRFGSTVAVLQWLGYPAYRAFAISFLVQWPLLVAGGIKGFLALDDPLILQMIMSFSFLLCMFIAMVIAYKLLCWIGKLIDSNQLWKFSYYMMAVTVCYVMIPILVLMF